MNIKWYDLTNDELSFLIVWRRQQAQGYTNGCNLDEITSKAVIAELVAMGLIRVEYYYQGWISEQEFDKREQEIIASGDVVGTRHVVTQDGLDLLAERYETLVATRGIDNG